MDPVALVVVPGILGGLLIALLIAARRDRWSGGPLGGDARATGAIDAARIRVAGVGGLGLVAMALAVAWGVPRIGQTLAVGLVLGTALAAAMILRRRKAGPMLSSGKRGGANTTLAIDDRPGAVEEIDSSGRQLAELTVLLAGGRD
jgi:hypothetical protein